MAMPKAAFILRGTIAELRSYFFRYFVVRRLMKLVLIIALLAAFCSPAFAQSKPPQPAKEAPRPSSESEAKPPVDLDTLFKDVEKDVKNGKHCGPKEPVSKPIA